MKAKHLVVLLVCSAFGLVLASAYVHRLTRASTLFNSAALAATPQEASPAPNSTGPGAPTAARGFSWRDIESEDYHRYIANLRSIGCPEQTIRDIVLADINKLYAARENPLKNPPKPTSGKPESSEEKLKRLQDLRVVQQEKRWAVKELLGIDLPLDLLPSSGNRNYADFEAALKWVPADKRDAVQALQENYWQQLDALQAKYGQKRTAEFRAESQQLTDSLHQDLAKVLSPQELEDYDIRTSSTAKQLGDKLAAYFHPTETEFRQIYRAKRDYDQAIEQLSAAPLPPTQPADPNDPQAVAQARRADREAAQQARSAALNRMNDQLKTTLGDARYTEYEHSQDRTYDLLARLGVRYGLPQETVLQAYDAQNSFKAPPPDPSGAVAPGNQAELQQQLNDRLTAILGEQAARGYRRVNGGSVPIKSP